MYRSEVKTERFDQDKVSDLEKYASIVANPLALIISDSTEKVSDKNFEDGQMVELHEHVVRIVTWEERSLL